jgi:hypothetical protein
VKPEGEENTQTKQRNIAIRTNEEEGTQQENTIGPDQFGKLLYFYNISFNLFTIFRFSGLKL